MRNTIIMSSLLALALISTSASAVYLGPSSYLSFDSSSAGTSISPFAGTNFQSFFLEDFEDGALNTPGVSLREFSTIGITTAYSDSVDGDDGVIDGFATGQTRSLFSNFSTSSFTFDFSASALGGVLPTHAGIVWTDIGRNNGGTPFPGDILDNTTFEAFDQSGNSLGVIGPFSFGDTSISRTTGEDQFLGVIHFGGISAISISMPGKNNWEVDHLQYGIAPAPDTSLLVGLDADGGAGWLETIDTSQPHANQNWFTVGWDSYNSAVGETRPVQCDLDGDGSYELVIGLGSYPSNGGWIEIKDDAAAGYVHLDWLRIDWANYNSADGQTWPACGDVDGDGKDEIIVGLGNAGQGWVKGFDDASTGYAPLPSTPTSNGWMRMNWALYNTTVGAIHPAVGNLDADSREEIVLGVGEGGGGWVEVLDDATASFAHLNWLQTGWTAYNTANGTTWPTICDLDGNNQGEIAIGLGNYTTDGGWVKILDSATNFAPLACTNTSGWIQVPWTIYNGTNGATHPACLNMDNDSADELVLGLGMDGAGWMDIREDCSGNVGHTSWARVHWSVYNNGSGLTWPASRR